MTYPVFYPFKTRVLNATSTTSNSVINPVAVPARSKLVDVFFVTNSFQTQTGSTGTADITVNGSTAGTAGSFTGWTGISVTSSTGNSSTRLGTTVSASVVYLNAGDVLATSLSSCVGGTTTYVLQEF